MATPMPTPGSIYWTRDLAFDATHTDTNPLRGFMAYETDCAKAFPHTLEYTYFSMHDLVQGDHHRRCCTHFTFDKVEEFLNSVKSRNHQGVFRVVVDYPNEPNFKPPAFLKCKVTKYKAYGDSGHYPDYSDTCLVDCMVGLIEEMGRRYDGDQRIASIMAGFLGFWGEWHMDINGRNMFPERAVQLRILEAFDRSFKRTQVCVSVDQCKQASGKDMGGLRIGYHDDSIGKTTQDYTLQNYTLAGPTTHHKWKWVAIGGEHAPDNQKTQFRNDQSTQSFIKDIVDLHASWVLNDWPFDEGYKPDDQQRAIVAARRLGYQFYVPKVEVAQHGLVVHLQNTGIAPFYHDLFLCAAINNGPPATAPFNFNFFLPENGVSPVFIPMALPPSPPLRVHLYLHSPALYPTQAIVFANANAQRGLYLDFP